MIIEQLIFTIIAFGLFIYFFYNIVKKNDTSYVVIIVLQAISIAISLFSFNVKLNWLLMVIKYIIGIVIPIAIIALEKNKIPLMELIDITKSNIYLKSGDNKKAKQALIHLVTKYPENYKGHKKLAEIYESEGGMRKAIDEYVQAIDIYKRDYDSYYKVAELLNGLDKQDEAEQMLSNLLKKKPEYYQATILLGDIMIKKDKYKEVVNIYQEALRYNPTSYELHYNLGIAYTMLNDFENAKTYYQKAADINNLLYNAKYLLAEIALIYKDLEKAKQYFMQAIEDEKLAPDAYYELAKIELVKGNKDIAIKYANTAIDANSKKIVPQIKNDTVFIPIIAKLSIPFNIEFDEQEKYILDPKEQKVKEHLENTFEITRQLSYNDVEIVNRAKNYENTQIEKEKGSREF